MAQRPLRSLKYEYALFVEEEIENYKESLPRSVLLGIGDDAVKALGAQQQLALTELLVCEEVDRIIFKRLRLPVYSTWRRKRVKLIAELRRPEHWGLRSDDVLVRALEPRSDARVLVAGVDDDAAALYSAANGCDVTAITSEVEHVERMKHAAIQAGLGERVHAEVADLGSWTPQVPLDAVIVNSGALANRSARERARIISLLQSATTSGGFHLVPVVASSSKGVGGAALSVDELRRRYRDWDVTVEGANGNGSSKSFLARKRAA